MRSIVSGRSSAVHYGAAKRFRTLTIRYRESPLSDLFEISFRIPLVTQSGSCAERRQLTVMFCDLAGSTELSYRLDPEEWRYISRAYQDVCKVPIERRGGYVDRYMGDGVLAYFGYPLAREDDAERAIYAVQRVVESIGQLAADNLVAESALRVCVGIATGPVVVGDLIGEAGAQRRRRALRGAVNFDKCSNNPATVEICVEKAKAAGTRPLNTPSARKLTICEMATSATRPRRTQCKMLLALGSFAMRQFSRIWISVVLLTAATGLNAAQFTTPTDVTILSEQELLSTIIGNTLDGRENRWLEYYEPPTELARSGKVIGVWSGLKVYTALWTIDGSLMCWRYPGHADLDGCWTLSLDGDKVTWYDEHGKRDYGKPGSRYSLLLMGDRTAEFLE